MATSDKRGHLVRTTIVAGFLAANLAGCGRQAPPAAPPAVEVTAVTVQPRTVPATFPYLAQIKSSQQVEIESRVNGYLKKICYKEGNQVRKGEVLFELDKRQYLADVEDARAEVEMKRAELATARATLDRTVPLVRENAASRKSLDEATNKLKSAEAALQQAQAKYDKAQLNVGYCTITMPVDGVAAQSAIREGGYVAAGGSSSKLTTVYKIDPVWVEFSISQNEQDQLNKEAMSGRLIAPKGGRYTVEVELPNGDRHPHTGTLTYGDFAYDKNGGELERAEIPNPVNADRPVLRPGMFVKVYIKGVQRPNALLVPQRAVRQGTKGHEVYVVNEKGLAELRPVTTGDWIGQEWVVTEGLKPGDRVVVDGGQKLLPGMPVKVTPAGADQAQAAKSAAVR